MRVTIREKDKGGFAPRGAILEIWKNYRNHQHITIVEGAAETGKTFGLANFIDGLLWKYPKCKIVLVRLTYNSLLNTAVLSYQRVIKFGEKECLIRKFGGERPQFYEYPNGSRLYLTGLDKPSKILSGEFDGFWIPQIEELAEEKVFYLATRCTGRGAVLPKRGSRTGIWADCNPDVPEHWIQQRKDITLLRTTHEDNPTLYDEQGNLTEQGRNTMAVLDTLPEPLYSRLRLGLWVGVEGQIWTEFNRSIHVIPDFQPDPEWRRVLVVDFGYNHPFVCQFWAVDDDGVGYMYREIYQTRKIVKEHAIRIAELIRAEQHVCRQKFPSKQLPIFDIAICDHDAEDRATLEHELRENGLNISTVPARKSVSEGIQQVKSRLMVGGNGKPKLFFCQNALVEEDPFLVHAKLPTSTIKEFPFYRWGDKKRENPVKNLDDGSDATRYFANTEEYAYAGIVGRY